MKQNNQNCISFVDLQTYGDTCTALASLLFIVLTSYFLSLDCSLWLPKKKNGFSKTLILVIIIVFCFIAVTGIEQELASRRTCLITAAETLFCVYIRLGAVQIL